VLEFPTAVAREAYLNERGWLAPVRVGKRLFVPSAGPSSWQALLSQPDLHWNVVRRRWSWRSRGSWLAHAHRAFPACVASRHPDVWAPVAIRLRGASGLYRTSFPGLSQTQVSNRAAPPLTARPEPSGFALR